MRGAAERRRSLHLRGEEAEARGAGIARVVPGVSSVVAAPNYAGIADPSRPLPTIRGRGRRSCETGKHVDWAQLAQTRHQVIMMGQRRFIAGARDPRNERRHARGDGALGDHRAPAFVAAPDSVADLAGASSSRRLRDRHR